MKKLTILAMAIILALSTFLMTACGEQEDAEIPVESNSRVEESSSAPTPISRRPKSSGGSNDNNSYKPPIGSSGSNKPVGSAHASGDPYTVTDTPTGGLSPNVASVVSTINSIGTINSGNYQIKGQYIGLAEKKLNGLTATEQAQVPEKSKSDLVNARNAYNAFLKSVATQYINDFKASVEAIKGFENDEAYNAKVGTAENNYALIDDQYKNEVANEYNILQAAKLHAEVNKVPDATSVTGEFYITVNNLKSKLASLAQNVASVYTKLNDDKAKLDSCFSKIMQTMVEKTYICCDKDGDGVVLSTEIDKKRDSVADKTGFFSVSGSLSSSTPITYSDSKNPTPFSCKYIAKSNLTFNAPNSGILTYYARLERECRYELSINGTVITSLETQQSNTAEQNVLVFEIPHAGKVEVKRYKLSGSEDTSSGFYAVKFLYSAA